MNAENRYGHTPLYYAALHGKLEVARPPADLARVLSPGAVLVDFVKYNYVEFERRPEDAGTFVRTPSYAAFVVRPAQPTLRVELGPSQPIDEAIAAWGNEIGNGRPPRSGARVRQLVWEPVEQHLSSQTQTVYLCPDGFLTFLPWAALPGSDEDSILLERYAFALVPFGPFLLEQLSSVPTARDDGCLLAVGGVSYDAQPQRSSSVLRGAVRDAREAARGKEQIHWSALPGTAREVEAIVHLADARPVWVLRNEAASTEMVLARLPTARWAHFATHAFFADPQFRSALQMDEKAFDVHGRSVSLWGERRTVGGRNPLVLSGLVLAGANLPRTRDELGLPQEDGGILTAEVIAGLFLHDLDLVVLSGCETGLGEVAGGEGVFGFQRAFHLAGARNVVASLWKVDDEATAALMKIFYGKLWQEGQPPIEALRQAQLAVYRHPDKIKDWARLQGEALAQATRGPVLAPKPLPKGDRENAELRQPIPGNGRPSSCRAQDGRLAPGDRSPRVPTSLPVPFHTVGRGRVARHFVQGRASRIRADGEAVRADSILLRSPNVRDHAATPQRSQPPYALPSGAGSSGDNSKRVTFKRMWAPVRSIAAC